MEGHVPYERYLQVDIPYARILQIPRLNAPDILLNLSLYGC